MVTYLSSKQSSSHLITSHTGLHPSRYTLVLFTSPHTLTYRVCRDTYISSEQSSPHLLIPSHTGLHQSRYKRCPLHSLTLTYRACMDTSIIQVPLSEQVHTSPLQISYPHTQGLQGYFYITRAGTHLSSSQLIPSYSGLAWILIHS